MVLDGCVRVSQRRGREGESFISPAVQREQIERWIGLRGGLLLQLPTALRRPALPRTRLGWRVNASSGASGSRACSSAGVSVSIVTLELGTIRPRR